MEGIFLEGFLLQASLIFALGSQNLFVLEQGMFGERPLLVSFLCFLCDLLLILFGVAGVGLLITEMPKVKIAFGILGVLLMVFYGITRLKNSDPQFKIGENRVKQTIWQLVLLSVFFSWLNPHAYIDAFILIGGQATKYSDNREKIIFGLGASFSSLCWFITLSHVAKYFSSILKKIMWLLNVCSVLIFLLMAIRMSYDVKTWIQTVSSQ